MTAFLQQAATDDRLADVPLYTVRDAAHYLRVPIWAVLAMIGRGKAPPEAGGCQPPGQDVVVASAPQEDRFSFRQFVEYYGRAFMAQGAAEIDPAAAWKILDGRESLSRPELVARLRLCLDRVEMREGVPARLFPFSRVPADGSPRTIVMDPRIRFGRPTVAGRGIPTDVLFERHQAGDSIAELAEDYGLTTAEVEEAIRYEAMPPATFSLPCGC